MRGTRYSLWVASAAALCLVLLYGGRTACAEEVNYCFVCHTNPAKLVPAVREAVKARMSYQNDLPGEKVEAEGEG